MLADFEDNHFYQSDQDDLNNNVDLNADDDNDLNQNEDRGVEIAKDKEAPKVVRAPRGYKPENLVEDTNGINSLFKTFTQHSETIDHLRGKGNEISDLNKIVGLFKGWHMQHQPKIEYYYFLERVRKHHSDKSVPVYLQKLRNHYKGVEMLEEFDLAFNQEPE